MDDMFVLLAAWRRTRIQDDVEKRLGDTYAEAAVSITITSITDMISFFIGVTTPFPSVQIFCLYTGKVNSPLPRDLLEYIALLTSILEPTNHETFSS